MELQDIKCPECFRYDRCLRHFKETKKKTLRLCQYAVEEDFYSKIRNCRVLEVGCGRKDKGANIKRIVEANGCKWTGIDIKRTDLTTHVCCVTKMPFDDDTFDWAVGGQTLEHWSNPKKGLKELARVLKPKAKLSLTAPIHLHGEKIFVRGDFEKIEKLINDSPFELELAQKWRTQTAKLPRYTTQYQERHLKKAGIKNPRQVYGYMTHFLLVNKKQNMHEKKTGLSARRVLSLFKAVFNYFG